MVCLTFATLLLCLLSAVVPLVPSTVVAADAAEEQQLWYESSRLRLGFSASSLELIGVEVRSSAGIWRPFQHASADATSLWSVQLVSDGAAHKALDVQSRDAQTRTHTHTCTLEHTQPKHAVECRAPFQLCWRSVSLPSVEGALLDVCVHFNADANEDGIDLLLEVQNKSPSHLPLGIWTAKLGFSAIQAHSHSIGLSGASEQALFVPYGFGRLLRSANTAHTADYPSGSSTMQFMAWQASYASSEQAVLYLGVHDGAGNQKRISATPLATSGVNTTGTGASYALSFEWFPANMARRFTTYRTSHPLSVSGVAGDWFDACQRYRDAMIPIASWLSSGPLEQRVDLPQWMSDTSVWVNTGWQPHDVFNQTQGDPSVVVERVLAIQELFDVPDLCLHWYEWDTIKFDTGYPEYFPAKEGFEAALHYLQQRGVRVFPYINGRIFDVNTKLWKHDLASKAAAKLSSENFGSTSLSQYRESYGSGATFAVMCPATEYWQALLADTVKTLVAHYKVDGVYIDQIGAAEPRLCFDESHSHEVGGGHLWTSGYQTMLQDIRLSNKGIGIMTESNSEPWMGSLHGYLTLDAFAIPPAGDDRLVPAFPAIYGGYYSAFGERFFKSDLQTPGLFSAKLTSLFMSGVGLGWFSLGGTESIPQMGLYDELRSGANRALIDYLKLLARFRRSAKRFLLFGRLLRPPRVLVDGQEAQLELGDRHPHVHRQRARGSIPFPFQSAMASLWKPLSSDGEAEQCVALFVANSAEKTKQRISVQFNVANELMHANVVSGACRLHRVDELGVRKLIDDAVSCCPEDIEIDVELPPLSLAFYSLCLPTLSVYTI